MWELRNYTAWLRCLSYISSYFSTLKGALSEILQWQYIVTVLIKFVMLSEQQVCWTEFYLANWIRLYISPINIQLTLNFEMRCKFACTHNGNNSFPNKLHIIWCPHCVPLLTQNTPYPREHNILWDFNGSILSSSRSSWIG